MYPVIIEFVLFVLQFSRHET